MTELGLFLYNDGKTDGISQEAFDNANNLFINGVSYDIVRNSIKNITDEKLKEIYDEVMANKSKTE